MSLLHFTGINDLDHSVFVQIFHTGARLLNDEHLVVPVCLPIDRETDLFNVQRLTQRVDSFSDTTDDILFGGFDLGGKVRNDVIVTVENQTSILCPILKTHQRFKIMVEPAVGVDRFRRKMGCDSLYNHIAAEDDIVHANGNMTRTMTRQMDE